MNHRTPQDKLVSHSLSLTARGEEAHLLSLPRVMRLSTQHRQHDIAFERITSSELSEQVIGVQALYQLASEGDAEAAHLLSEVASSSREVVTHLNLNAERLVAWAAELGHSEARFYLAMQALDGSEEQERIGLAKLSELALEGFKEAVAFMSSMKITH